MKALKIMIVAFAASVTVFTAKADNDRPITIEQLPAVSRQFIQDNFQGLDVSYAKSETEFFDKTYDVFFVNGTKVEFNKQGQWTDVDCMSQEVPASIVPEQIRSLINRNHPGQRIVKIDRDKRDYEVELSNGLEITFDLRFNIIGYDD